MKHYYEITDNLGAKYLASSKTPIRDKKQIPGAVWIRSIGLFRLIVAILGFDVIHEY